ncbi:Lacal_2735 family protein [Aquimarina litoralis]|uniref:Lacal_2735 family protein n=1 Tax=Aquimarina litoralis TaxID=584605 RepID=UPI001C56E76F|nr:Lacal_2735 family protein [Aquimarina litoralis]MBW1295882.1 Lacal_2735 family protein [Aquimarina litoralis]
MFTLFKKKTERERLQKKYKTLMEESYKLSHTNRKASDEKQAEAADVLKKIEQLPE